MLQDILSGKILASQFIVSIGAENDFSDYFTLNLSLVRTKGIYRKSYHVKEKTSLSMPKLYYLVQNSIYTVAFSIENAFIAMR